MCVCIYIYVFIYVGRAVCAWFAMMSHVSYGCARYACMHMYIYICLYIYMHIYIHI